MITINQVHKIITEEYPEVFNKDVIPDDIIHVTSTFNLTRQRICTNYYFNPVVFSSNYRFKLNNVSYHRKMEKWLYDYLKTIIVDREFKIKITKN